MSNSIQSSLPKVVSIASAMALILGGVIFAADQAKIKTAIAKGQKFLLQEKLNGPEGSLAALALIKSGTNKKSVAIQSIVDEILEKFQSEGYRPRRQHHYEAAVDMMVLEAVDAESYLAQLQLISTYLISQQQSNGAWFYPFGTEPDCGDTSITQYAVMGLWAAVRAGVQVPPDVLEKAARWHITKQQEDGGFCYHPFDFKLPMDPDARRTTGTMTAAGSSTLLIVRRILFGDADFESSIRPPDSKRRFGVLEKFADDKRAAAPAAVTLRVSAIDRSLKDSIRWMTEHIDEKSNKREMWFTYRLYSIERVAALMDIEKFGGHDWYDAGSNELLNRQLANGSWNDSSQSIASTSLGLLFLSKATSTIVSPKKKIALLGGGLQAGGRGLPDNLDSVEINDGTVSSRKIVGAVDNLLIELERSSDAKVEAVQATVVEAIQLDHPDELIGQVGRLRKLATDPRIEVRRTALWALGRSEDISASPTLIQALSDSDLSVAREASLGLCVLSRRPEGLGGIPIDPTEDLQMKLSESSTEQERSVAIGKWRTDSKRHWTDWYFKNRSYDERDDRVSLKRTNK